MTGSSTTTTTTTTVGGAGADAAGRLSAIVDELSDQFFERDQVIRGLVVAMLARQHSLLLGPPGTGKSELARALTSRIDGARHWEILLGKFTDPKRIFGPIDVEALMRGEYKQVWVGRATEADIAFIDEVFKASAGALNEMLAYLNERLYHPENGGAPIQCPLISAITASNELPASAELAAIYDRLLVRFEVDYIADPSNMVALLRQGAAAAPAKPPTKVPLVDLQQATETDVPAVVVPDGIIDAVCQLRTQLRQQSLLLSDRRWKQCIPLLQASAFLGGRGEVEDVDLAILAATLWDLPADRSTVEREVLSLVNPDAREALDLQDAIEELNATLDTMAGQSRQARNKWAIEEANTKLNDAQKRLKKMHADAVAAGRSTTTVDQALARHRAVQSRVLVEVLGIDPTMVQTQL